MKLILVINYLIIVTLSFVLFQAKAFSQSSAAKHKYHLIAHRGGVVDENTPENSRASIEKAIGQGYWMVEIDLRLTKDSVLIIHHDRNLKRYYNVDATVDQSTWKEIKDLRSPTGASVLKFEDALKICKGKIQVMIDNKINGNDTVLFGKVIALLKEYGLYDGALTIGTDESTEYFTGKIKLSCTREQLENNMKRADYHSSNYYLFSNKITREDAAWARQNNILTVGVLNSWALKNTSREKIREIAEDMKAAGVTHFQLDSEYAGLLTP